MVIIIWLIFAGMLGIHISFAYDHEGCFADVDGDRAMGTRKDAVDSIGDCDSLCDDYAYFAVQYETHCWCDNSYTTAVRHGSSDGCTDGTGGGWCFDLYYRGQQGSCNKKNMYEDNGGFLDWLGIARGACSGNTAQFDSLDDEITAADVVNMGARVVSLIHPIGAYIGTCSYIVNTISGDDWVGLMEELWDDVNECIDNRIGTFHAETRADDWEVKGIAYKNAVNLLQSGSENGYSDLDDAWDDIKALVEGDFNALPTNAQKAEELLDAFQLASRILYLSATSQLGAIMDEDNPSFSADWETGSVVTYRTDLHLAFKTIKMMYDWWQEAYELISDEYNPTSAWCCSGNFDTKDEKCFDMYHGSSWKYDGVSGYEYDYCGDRCKNCKGCSEDEVLFDFYNKVLYKVSPMGDFITEAYQSFEKMFREISWFKINKRNNGAEFMLGSVQDRSCLYKDLTLSTECDTEDEKYWWKFVGTNSGDDIYKIKNMHTGGCIYGHQNAALIQSEICSSTLLKVRWNKFKIGTYTYYYNGQFQYSQSFFQLQVASQIDQCLRADTDNAKATTSSQCSIEFAAGQNAYEPATTTYTYYGSSWWEPTIHWWDSAIQVKGNVDKPSIPQQKPQHFVDKPLIPRQEPRQHFVDYDRETPSKTPATAIISILCIAVICALLWIFIQIKLICSQKEKSIIHSVVDESEAKSINYSSN